MKKTNFSRPPSLSLPLLLVILLCLVTGCASGPATGQASPAQGTSKEGVPAFPREFRAAWSACIYNIDWPKSKGLSAGAQKAQLLRILNRMESLKMNALVFQVRPHADAVYRSSIEPWSPWLSGTMGRSPGYDPLQYCIEQAHARGIEVHAWFNPFRALPNASMPTSSNHVTRTNPRLIKRYSNYKWMDISQQAARSKAVRVIMDVVNRYDVDGVHLDDYFYPYPKPGAGSFPDGKSPAQRRGYVDSFVKDLYGSVKSRKPWVRVGISPFGIWQPGVPAGIEASVNAYEDLAADSRKWLKNGWVDYLSPQLYWRDQPRKQSYSALLNWWRAQGSRPVWPGIATSRIQSSDDPGRPASEITRQVALSRSLGRNYAGHCHWSVNALMQNRGGISSALSRGAYASPALVPPMPWASRKVPAQPTATLAGKTLKWKTAGAKQVTIQRYANGRWSPSAVLPAYKKSYQISPSAQKIAIRAVNRYGSTSAPVLLEVQ